MMKQKEMSIRISQHILSIDEHILAVGLFSKQFHMVETATRPTFDKRFTVSPGLESSGPAYAAVVYSMVKMLEEPFGNLDKIVVDYAGAKIMLVVLRNGEGYVGLVLSPSVNADYLALKLKVTLNAGDNSMDISIDR
jgi:hypothetical protein